MSDHQKKTLILEDRAIRGLLADPRVTALIPCLDGPRRELESLKPGHKNCLRCAAAKKRLQQRAQVSALQCLASLNLTTAGQLKGLLGVEEIQLIVTESDGIRRLRTL